MADLKPVPVFGCFVKILRYSLGAADPQVCEAMASIGDAKGSAKDEDT